MAVVAPGAGVGSIGDIFLELDADPDLQARDPPSWGLSEFPAGQANLIF